MFCNWQGIKMGEQGEIWIGSIHTDDDTSELKIIAINNLE